MFREVRCVCVCMCVALIYICILYDAFGGMCVCGGGVVLDFWCETVCNLFSSYFLLIIYAYPHDGYAALKVPMKAKTGVAWWCDVTHTYKRERERERQGRKVREICSYHLYIHIYIYTVVIRTSCQKK